MRYYITLDKVAEVRRRNVICDFNKHVDQDWLCTAFFGHVYPKAAESNDITLKRGDILKRILPPFHEYIFLQGGTLVRGMVEYLFDLIVT